MRPVGFSGLPVCPPSRSSLREDPEPEYVDDDDDDDAVDVVVVDDAYDDGFEPVLSPAPQLRRYPSNKGHTTAQAFDGPSFSQQYKHAQSAQLPRSMARRHLMHDELKAVLHKGSQPSTRPSHLPHCNAPQSHMDD
eukprot:c34850_g1_i1.p2 GENE.c34850_g1_i1~~c34850_g1_i1.p2  ORF type:complete len:136 (-),score=17.41 c34850_g1_i1:219-626(-)